MLKIGKAGYEIAAVLPCSTCELSLLHLSLDSFPGTNFANYRIQPGNKANLSHSLVAMANCVCVAALGRNSNSIPIEVVVAYRSSSSSSS